MNESPVPYSKGLRTPESRASWAAYYRRRRKEGREAIADLEVARGFLAKVLAGEIDRGAIESFLENL